MTLITATLVWMASLTFLMFGQDWWEGLEPLADARRDKGRGNDEWA